MYLREFRTIAVVHQLETAKNFEEVPFEVAK